MADISAVLQAVVDGVAGAVYPQGQSGESVAGCDVRVYPGWPLPARLDADMAAGHAHVSVWAAPAAMNVRTYGMAMRDTALIDPCTMTATVSGTAMTLAGELANVAAVILTADGADYAHAVAQNDTLATVAAALAAAVGGSASAAGAVLTLPGTHRIALRATVTGTLRRELRRQERMLQITVWAPTPAIRAQLAARVDQYLAAADRITLADGTAVVMRYRSDAERDDAQKVTVYRRDLMYSAEYPTTDDMPAFTISRALASVEAEGPPA